MAQSVKDLLVKLSLDNQQLLKANKKMQKELDGSNKKVKGLRQSFSKLKGVYLAVAGVIAGKIVGGLTKATEQAAKYQQAISQTSKQFGVDANILVSSLRKVSDGTISNFDLIESANKALALNVTKDTGQLTKILEVARIKGKALGLDTKQAFDDLVTGIGRGSPLILDNLGIITKGWDKLAKQQGVAFDSQFILNKVLQDGAELLEKTGPNVLSNAEKFQKFRSTIKNVTDSIGGKFIPILTSVAEGVADLFAEEKDLEQITSDLVKTTEAYNKVTKELEKSNKDLTTSETAKKILQQTTLNIRLGRQIGAIIRLAKQRKTLIPELEREEDKLTKQLETQTKTVSNYNTLLNALDAGTQAYTSVLNQSRIAAEKQENIQEKLNRVTTQITDSNTAYEASIEKLADGFNKGIISYERLQKLTPEVRNEVLNLAETTEDNTKAADKNTKEIKKNTDEKTKNFEITQKLKGAIQGTTDALNEVEKAGPAAAAIGKDFKLPFKPSDFETTPLKELLQLLEAAETTKFDGVSAIKEADIRKNLEQARILVSGTINEIKKINIARKQEGISGLDVERLTFKQALDSLREKNEGVRKLFNRRKEDLGQSLAEGLRLEREATAKRKALAKEIADEAIKQHNRWLKEQEQLSEIYLDSSFDAAKAGIDLLFQYEQQKRQENFENANKFSEELRKLDEQDAELKKQELEEQLAGAERVGNKEEADAIRRQLKRSELRKKEAEEEKKLKREAFVKDKEASVIQSIINTALAVGKFLAKGDSVQAIYAGIQGGIQTATIAAQPIPQFANGGVIKGLPGGFQGEDGIIAAQNGESVLTKQATAVLGEDAINALNRGENISPTNVTINVQDGREAVDILDDYFKTRGTSSRGLSI